MPSYTLRGIEVQFPHEAYECQVNYSQHMMLIDILACQRFSKYRIAQVTYMEKVITALQEVHLSRSPEVK